MLKRIIVTVVTAFCFTAGAVASAPEKTIFQGAATQAPEILEANLKEKGVIEDGKVSVKKLAVGLHGWAITSNLLNDEAVKDVDVFAAALTERYGEYLSTSDLVALAKSGKLVVPAKVARPKGTPPTAVAAAPVQPAVPAASAPNAPAPVAVAEAPTTPVAKSAPMSVKAELPPNVVTDDKLNAAIRQHQEATVASTDSLAKTLFGVAKREAKTVAELKRSVAAIAGGDKQLEKKMLALVEQEAALRKTQIQGANDHIGRTDGRVSVLDNKLFWVMVTLAVFAIGLVVLWFRTSAAKKEAKATVVTTKAAIEAAASHHAAAVTKMGTEIGAVRALVANKAERKQLEKLAERVEVVEAVVYEDPEWELTAEQREKLFGLVFNLKAGETAEFELVLEQGTVLLKFVDQGEDLVSVDGIDVRPFHKKKVCTKVTEFYHSNKLPQPLKLTPVKLAA